MSAPWASAMATNPSASPAITVAPSYGSGQHRSYMPILRLAMMTALPANAFRNTNNTSMVGAE